MSDRKEAVSKLLSSVHYKTQEDKNDVIESFSNANLSLDEIEKLIIPLRPGYLKESASEVNNRPRAGVF